MSLRDRVVQSVLVAAVIGGINLWRNGVNAGNIIAAVFVFAIWMTLATFRARLGRRR